MARHLIAIAVLLLVAGCATPQPLKPEDPPIYRPHPTYPIAPPAH